MKNKLSDLNDHLFGALERLNDETLEGDKLKTEIDRSKAISGLARELVSSASVELEARKFVAGDDHRTERKLPAIMQDAPRLAPVRSQSK